jgi:hypothetical protein
MNPRIAQLADEIAGRYAQIPGVEAVAMAGSRSSQFADEHSDVDLYVYVLDMLPLARRTEVGTRATRAEIGNNFWEPGDEWVDAPTGISIDVMFRTTRWIEDQLDRVLQRFEASLGYSTCFWYNVQNSRALFDRNDWFRTVREKANRPYPRELRTAVIEKNYPVLRRNLSSYLHQIDLALQRDDLVSVHHRLTALLASYFDIVFAANQQPHPGEKRLLQYTECLCPHLPQRMTEQVCKLLSAPWAEVLRDATVLLDNLDIFLTEQNLLPQ